MAITDKKCNIEEGELSASDLVLDLLAAHDQHRLPVAALCRAAMICGIREQNVRVALSRLSQQGKVASTDRGSYALNSGSNSLLRDVDNWLRREQQAVAWNGGWIGVVDGAVPRRHKVVWRRHERALLLRGFRPLKAGLHLRPDNLKGGVAAVRHDLQGLGLAGQALVMAVYELSDADEQQARGLWNLKALERSYRSLIRRLQRSQARFPRQTDERIARESLLLGREAIRTILHDPLLPESLMGGGVRHQLIECMRDYQTVAKTVWLRLLEE
ncbi:PaaX family transcriptional regulator C-terminal domain-containing protein [Alloalcanivorax mobilis]|jgi:phenylacetic acid degradation operon negative regulatory protein|uniref:PaaX family transcriptional regulator C-terminal domain-containing protein n=1 Tax=Alloalcanivorax mobilis TaxID=2019569 RepID=UPI000B5B1A69|nr:PaaX family transcriptional regulator C-terminal domain-containing protein [Alloalcanivorax mobilis]ASK33348.1 PaaX family transcriptional regulator [Alcanivorax sp. N3-2A]|tara:strand:- start:44650 stop:45465 length:816 start_codon:yes stop_codon:yes gene_type:complete